MRAALFTVAGITLAVALAAGCKSSLEVYPLRPPDQISARYVKDSSEVRWSAVPGASSYVIYGSRTSPIVKESAHRSVVSTDEATALLASFSDNLSLKNGEKLHIAVAALAGNAESDLSSDVEITVVFQEMAQTPIWEVSGEAPGDRFGAAVATGDVNGDGLPDLVIGAPNAGVNAEGVIYSYLGTPMGLSTSADPRWTLHGGQPNVHLGKALALAPLGFEPDGFDYLVAGAPNDNFPGLLYVYRSSFLGFDPSSGYAERGGSSGGTVGDSFGSSLAIVDLNHDGHLDILCGAPGFANGWVTTFAWDAGSIYYGVNLNTPIATYAESSPGAKFGSSIAALGDIDGDTFPDAAIGAPGFGGAGKVRVVLGTARTIDIAGTHPNGEFGFAVANAGDVTGDGIPDLAIGEPGFLDSGSQPVGGLSVYRAASSTAMALVGTAGGVNLSARFGASISSMGNIDEYDFDDLITGSPGFLDSNNNPAGLGFVFRNFGTANAGGNWIVSGAPGDALGATVLGVSDMNGDGRRDAVVTAPGEVPTAAGYVRLYVTNSKGPTVSAGYGIVGTITNAVTPGPVLVSGLSPTACHRCIWNWGDGTMEDVQPECTASNAGNFSHVYTSSNRYAVRLRVECNDGRQSEAVIHADIAP